MSAGPRIAFSTLAFPDASLATALSLGRGWGYGGVELRLIDGELIDPSMPAAARAEIRRTAATAGLPIAAVDSSIRLTGRTRGRSCGSSSISPATGWILVEWEKRCTQRNRGAGGGSATAP